MKKVFPASGVIIDTTNAFRKRIRNYKYPTGVIIEPGKTKHINRKSRAKVFPSAGIIADSRKPKPANRDNGVRRFRDEIAQYLRIK